MFILPSALNLSYCFLSSIDIFPAIFTAISTSPDIEILSIGRALESAVRSILPFIEALKSGSLMGVFSDRLISNGLPASSIWNLLTSTVVLSISLPSIKTSDARFIFFICSGSDG